MKQKSLTQFEWAVLKATAQIPLGETRSYQWVARQLGRPKAVRAVGQALHKNPFAPIIPCHRVIREDGSMGGYAGGLKKKERLLEMEKDIARSLANVRRKFVQSSKRQVSSKTYRSA